MKPSLRALLASTALALACESDTTRPILECMDSTCPGFPITRENLFNVLEASYNRREIASYERLLDAEFTFFFWPGDVGGNVPEQWGRADELEAVTRLFDKNLNDPNYPTCRSIRVDFKSEEGVQWIEVIPEQHPDETWYTTTVEYDFTFEMNPDQTWIAVPGVRSQFTVRNVGTDAAPQWRLVEWRDLGADSVLVSPMSTMSTQPTTLGAIKSLYR